MTVKTAAGLVLVGFGVAACGDADPAAVDSGMSAEDAVLEARSDAPGQADRASLLTGVPVTFDGREGTVTITRMEANPEAGSDLLVDGILEFEEDGVAVTEVFSGVPADLSRTPPMGSMMAAQRAPDESGVCDILYLDLGPLFLDLLGLTVDLAPIELDVDAEPGSGNLLGNLLCAVTGLLDGGPLAAIDNLLDQINSILDGVTGLLTDIPVTGAVDGGILEGTLSLTNLALNAEGNLVASGSLTGTVNLDGTLTEISQTFEDVTLGLTEVLDTGALMMAAQRAPNEEDACDVLYLDLGPIFLDVLGLTVDLSQIELDIDAQRGSGNLLGNLLCALTGLLDGGIDGLLDEVQGLLDRINNLLG